MINFKNKGLMQFPYLFFYNILFALTYVKREFSLFNSLPDRVGL